MSQPYAEIDGGGNILGLAFQNGGGAFDDGIPVDGGSALQGAELACLFQQAFIARALTGFCACGSSIADGKSSQFSKLHMESGRVFLVWNASHFKPHGLSFHGKNAGFSLISGRAALCRRLVFYFFQRKNTLEFSRKTLFAGASAPVRVRCNDCFSGLAGEGGDCCRWRLRQLSRNVCHCGMLCSDRLLPVLVSEWRRVWFVTFL